MQPKTKYEKMACTPENNTWNATWTIFDLENHAKKRNANYFTSSDPHHDISKQPR